jgi:hypothetical protein
MLGEISFDGQHNDEGAKELWSPSASKIDKL